MFQIIISANNAGRWRRAGLLLLAGLLFLWLAYTVREIWLPLIIAFVIAMVLDPLVDKMESRGWSRLTGALLIYLLFFAALAGVLIVAVPAVVAQATVITKQIGTLPTAAASGNEAATKKQLEKLMTRMHAAPSVKNVVDRTSSQISRGLTGAVAWVDRTLQALLSNVLWLVLIPLVSFYALKDLHLIYARLLLLVPKDQRVNAQNFLNEVSAIFVRYLRGLMIVCALNAVATVLVLMLFKVPDPLGLGAISGILYSVPYLGPVLTYAIVGGVALISGKAVLPILGILIVLHSVIFDQIITPRVLGQHVGLHPILAIIALLVGASLLGIVGMILSVPIAAIIQMVVLALIPKLNAPIDVPTGEQLHSQVDEATAVSEKSDEVAQTPDVHKTIVAAVDTAEEQEEQAEREGSAPKPFTTGATTGSSEPAASKK